jgi:hypothetical protein
MKAGRARKGAEITMTNRHRTWITATACALALAVSSPMVGAQQRSGPTPPRLGLVDGNVSFWRPGAEDWTAAQLNTALAEGDELYAASGANLELQIGARAFVRAGGDSRIALKALDDGFSQYEVTGGHVAFDLKTLPRRMRIEVDTPAAAFTIDRPGYYRVDVDDNDTSFSARRGGSAHVVAVNGDETDVHDGQRVAFAGGHPNVQTDVAMDDWDRWNDDRTARFAENSPSGHYVSSEVAGVDDLDRYGDWREEPRYGRVWVPRGVASDWAPYSTGRWVYDPAYSWTWVDDAPWGWCPYHYGRWANFSGTWGWAPGPIVAQPVYSPALVAFFGAPGIGVSVGVGVPFVSWVALGFGEPVYPWWGGAAFVGHPWWGGWGGAHVNNTFVHNTFVNANRYANFGVRNAVVGIDRGRFGRGDRPTPMGDRIRDPGRLQTVRGDLGVRPGPHSLVPRTDRGRRPPDRLESRPTVATRAARDPMQRLRERGVQTASGPNQRRPEQRIVGGGRGPNRGLDRPNADNGLASRSLDPRGNGHRGIFDANRNAGQADRPNQPNQQANRGASAPEPPHARGRAQGFDRHASPEPPQGWRGGRNADRGTQNALGERPNDRQMRRDLRQPSQVEPQHGPRGRTNEGLTRRSPAYPNVERHMERRFNAPRESAPLPRLGSRGGERPQRNPSFERPSRAERAPARPQQRHMQSAPHESSPVPMPRGNQTRFERRAPERHATMRQPRMQSAPRGSARPPMHAERGGGGGGHRSGGHGHGREG